MKTIYEILNGPCIFCGYNGQGYFKEMTHAQDCPWYEIGGSDERVEHFMCTLLTEMIEDKKRIDYLETWHLKKLNLTMDGKNVWQLGNIGRLRAKDLRDAIDQKMSPERHNRNSRLK